MKWEAPEACLALFVAAAGLCLVGGWPLARERVETRMERSREAHHTFLKRLDDECDRLEQLYQSHLKRLATFERLHDTIALRQEAETIIGVVQISSLSPTQPSRTPYHLPVHEAPLPTPTFSEDDSPFQDEHVRLDPKTFVGTEGWIDDPGKPLFYWHQRKDRSVALLLIDRPAVAAAMTEGLKSWLPEAFAPLAVQEGEDALLSPAGALIAGAPLTERPHAIMPLPTRFGTWQLTLRDPIRSQIHYRWPFLITSGLLAALFLGLGFLVYGYQRRAAKLAQTRVSFANQVSHELRSPLTNIVLNADLIEDQLPDDGSARRRLTLIQEEAHRLGRLISNVLTFSRRESGRHQLQLAPATMDSLVDDVLSQFAVSLERLHIEVDFHRGAATPALLDHDAVFQIVANLVSNVEKYAAQGAWLSIRTSIRDARLHLEVADRGPGIARNDIARAFESFVRLNERVDEGTSGTGLGLAIARGLAEDMGGTLNLVPSEQGARFELTLPLVTAASPHLS